MRKHCLHKMLAPGALGFTMLLAACGGSAAPASPAASASSAAASVAAGSAGKTGQSGASSAATSQAAAGSAGKAGQAGASSDAPSQAAGATGASASANSGSGASGKQSAAPASAAAAAAPSVAPDPNALRIGQILPLSGPLATIGKDYEDGFNLYLDSVGGAVDGRKIQSIYVDDQSGRPDVALTEAKQLVEQDHVQILSGLNNTAVCYAVAGYAKQAQEPTVAAASCGSATLMTDPKYASPYLVRISQSPLQYADVAADWMYKQGYRNIGLISTDFGGGIEASDALASAFIKRGGHIAQEIHPPQGASSWGPYVGVLYQGADAFALIAPGADAQHFLDSYGSFVSPKKPVVDVGGAIAGQNLAALKDKAVGVVSTDVYSQAYDSPMNQAFLKAFAVKYPGRAVSDDVAKGYVSGQAIGEALNKVKGKADDKAALLDALHALNLETIKGPLKLDGTYDAVQNVYVSQAVKTGGVYSQKLLETYKALSPFWDFTQAQVDKLQPGTHKDKWVAVGKDQLAAITGS